MYVELHNYRGETGFFPSVIKDGIFDKSDEAIIADEVNETPPYTTQHQPESTTNATTVTERKTELKTELATLLDGFSLKKPASVNAVVLWNCIGKHPTDLSAKKGERVKILYRNGELAFVENSQQKQGFIPLCYCALYRRRSSSFSELFTETSRKILSVEDIAPSTDTGSGPPSQCDSLCKEVTGEAVKRKRFGKMISKGTYDAKGAENRGKKKSEKGILNSAAKKLMKAFTSTLPSRAKGKTYKSVQEKKPIPGWLQQLNFDYHNPDYSSSTDSSDEDDDSAYESFRPASETRQSVMLYNGTDNTTAHADEHLKTQETSHKLTVTNKYSREFNSQEFAIGYANVRRLRTSSQSSGNRISRSRSFNLDSKTKTLHRILRRKPKDLLDSSDNNTDLDDDEDRILANNVIRRTPSDGCIPHDNSYGFQSENLMVVLQDFITGDSKDLNVLKGQRVRVLNKNNDEWWMCETENGRGGFVPREYLTAEHSTTWTKYGDIDDGYFTKGRSDWQEFSFRTKAASVKLARITPMAREPPLQQNGNPGSDINLAGWVKIDSCNNREWKEDVHDLKTGGLYTEECHGEECYECIAACSTCHQNLIVGNSYSSSLKKCHEGVQNEFVPNDSAGGVYEKDGSEPKIWKAEEEELHEKQELEQGKSLKKQHEPRSRDPTDVNQTELPKADCNALANSNEVLSTGVHVDKNGKPKATTTEGVMECDTQLPTYDEIMGQRNLDELSEIQTRLSYKINAMRKDMEQKPPSNPGQVERLLEEWRSQQKQSTVVKLPTLERGTSSDSQSTISDSLDSVVPRVLRRRSSTSKRVRFQTPESKETSDGASESEKVAGKSEKVEANSCANKENILATWL